MKFEPQKITIEDSMDAIIDYRGKTPQKSSSGIPLITAKIVKNGTILPPTEFIPSDDYDNWMVRGLPEVGDVVLTTEAPLGEVAQLWDTKIALAQRIVTLRGKSGLLHNDYLVYLLQSSTIQNQLNARSTGTTVKGIKQSELRKIVLDIPSLDYQKWTAECLQSLDRKIKNNNQINQTLEKMAQALFKSWFVDFEPVKAKIAVLEAGGSQEDATLAAMTAISGKDADSLAVFEQEHPEKYAELKATAELFPSALQDSGLGEIPERWNVSLLEDATSLIIDHRGKTPKKLGGDWSEEGHPAISAKNIKDGRLVRYDAIKYVDSDLYAKWMKDKLLAGDILMTSEAPLGELLYLAKDCDYLLSQRLYGIRANNEIISGSYLYFWLQTSAAKADINGRATGSTVVGIRQSELKKVNVMVPQKAVVDSFSNLTALYLEKIESNEKQNIVLKKLRDTLLPKLLSGEITLPEAEELAKEADYV
ncbi:restriction endonuclease subunit S [Klebsiella aerogenes]|uniref:restriction endonuclease subunit S n=1 Tax=Klebsiella aerogenes TaxID=548 RepID=UPI000B410EFD|nr:restriction endonuclease subunit S [Klebsiella aerogenes]EKU0355082.1 restriction endonuclease subunit S [Klebsiella aerogenes]ELA3179232.1 restriction endonuclease subunit S [Klebsiella aerogenes]ELN9407112.1 restriction endonuclease subunit S [Klebsiella aerogenes]ELX9633571.1 restriction endonuclease subunit S [Klebsiella aerogenes]RNT18080.1 restriction endonuclease subunit S [Klebsiella aerogenes]